MWNRLQICILRGSWNKKLNDVSVDEAGYMNQENAAASVVVELNKDVFEKEPADNAENTEIDKVDNEDEEVSNKDGDEDEVSK